MYVTKSDLIDQLTDMELIQLTDDEKTGQVDVDTVNRAITSAEAIVDGYLKTRYMTPVAPPVPELVRALTIDCAVYALYRRRKRVPDDVRLAYEDAIRTLEGIARGVVTLGVTPPPSRSAESSQGALVENTSEWSRKRLAGF